MSEDIDKNKVFGIVSYLGILFLIPLIFAKDSAFARYHANQGAVLFLCTFVAYLVVVVTAMTAGLIPVIGDTLTFATWWILRIVCLLLIILGIINAAKGEMRPLPLIGQIRLLK